MNIMMTVTLRTTIGERSVGAACNIIDGSKRGQKSKRPRSMQPHTKKQAQSSESQLLNTAAVGNGKPAINVSQREPAHLVAHQERPTT
jgi:hypothetical protein